MKVGPKRTRTLRDRRRGTRTHSSRGLPVSVKMGVSPARVAWGKQARSHEPRGSSWAWVSGVKLVMKGVSSRISFAMSSKLTVTSRLVMYGYSHSRPCFSHTHDTRGNGGQTGPGGGLAVCAARVPPGTGDSGTWRPEARASPACECPCSPPVWASKRHCISDCAQV